MSTSPDEVVGVLSRWLARHVDNDQLEAELGEVDRASFSAEQAEAVDELLAELRGAAPNARGQLERVVRETLEAVALG